MKRIFRYLRPYALFAVISPLLMMGEVACDLFLPKLMTVIVDCGIVRAGDVSSSGLGTFLMRLLRGEGLYGSMEVIVTLGITMLCVVLVGGFFGTFCAYTAAKASQSMGHDLRRDAYRHVMSLSVEQTDKFTTGSLVTRMTNDVSMCIEFCEMILRMFVRAPMFLIGGIVMLLTLHVSFGYILLFSMPILVVVLVLVMRKTVPIYGGIQKRLDKVNCVVQENVSGARVVKAYVSEDYECGRFDRANADLRDTNLKVNYILAILSPVMTLVLNGAVIGVIYLGGWQIENIAGTGMSAGVIMAAIEYLTRILGAVMMVTNMATSISRAMASVRRLNEVLDTEPVVVGGEKTEGTDTENAVVFKGVTFRYPGTNGDPVLRGIDLAVRKGETFAVVGATGSGKTTLVGLIPRFYDATEGEVLVEGIDVKEWDLSALRSRIGYVMQKSELFSATIEKNIRMGDRDATDEAVDRAMYVAQAQDFVSSFTDGKNTFIAEKGASLSGGQKQRISIARGLVRSPEILIFDDATSALDFATEAKLRRALAEEMRGSTVIMIAQRIASVRDADRICVIDGGEVVGCASHEELLATCPTYREICASQRQNGGDGK